MTSKSLESKAIDIKGKKYVLVSDRVIYFNEKYPNGAIETEILSPPDSEMVVVQARVFPDVEIKERYFVAHSQARWGEGMVNKTAALENAETSAVGRALAMMGIGVIDSVASADEVRKAGVSEKTERKACEFCGTTGKYHKPGCPNAHTAKKIKAASELQKKKIFAMAKAFGMEADEIKEIIKAKYDLDSFNDLTVTQASEFIEGMIKEESEQV